MNMFNQSLLSKDKSKSTIINKYISKINCCFHTTYSFLGIKIKMQFRKKHKKTVNILLDPQSGIGNRIFGIINSLNYFTPDVLNIYWDTTNWVNCRLKDIFNIETSTQINEYNSADFIENTDKDAFTILSPTCGLRNNYGKSISLMYQNTSHKDILSLAPLFQKIKPSKKVIERMESLPQNIDYALQIRNNKDWDAFGRNENIELFFDELRKLPKDSKVYISAMSKEVSDEVKKHFGNMIIELPDKDYSSMIDAAADMYMLSRARNGIYSYGSTFSELAFWLGGAKQNVVTVGSEKNWKYN